MLRVFATRIKRRKKPPLALRFVNLKRQETLGCKESGLTLLGMWMGKVGMGVGHGRLNRKESYRVPLGWTWCKKKKLHFRYKNLRCSVEGEFRV